MYIVEEGGPNLIFFLFWNCNGMSNSKYIFNEMYVVTMILQQCVKHGLNLNVTLIILF